MLIEMEVPNLTCMDAIELDDMEQIFGKLRNYAMERQAAIIARLDGDIPTALFHENNCDAIYDSLPVGIRW